MIVVTGAPCSGKTSHILKNRQSDDIIVDLDRIAEALGAPPGNPLTSKMREVAQALRLQLVDSALAGRIEGQVWIVDTWLVPEALTRYSRSGANFRLVDPGLATCLDRAYGRPLPRGTQDIIQQWYAHPPALPANCAVFRGDEQAQTSMKTPRGKSVHTGSIPVVST